MMVVKVAINISFQILKLQRVTKSNSSNALSFEPKALTPLGPIRAKTEHDVSIGVKRI